MRTRIVLATLLLCGTAAAEDRPAPPAAPRLDLESGAALVVTVATCAALHAAPADMLDSGNLHEHAATARRRAEVDQLTAMYLLAEDRVAKGGAPQPLASFTSYVEELTAAAYDRMRAIVAHEDKSTFQREEDFCAQFIPLEDEVLGKISVD
jgi:hypothetical protein